MSSPSMGWDCQTWGWTCRSLSPGSGSALRQENENRRSYASRDPTRTPHPASAPAAASMVAEAPHWGKVAPVQGRAANSQHHSVAVHDGDVDGVAYAHHVHRRAPGSPQCAPAARAARDPGLRSPRPPPAEPPAGRRRARCPGPVRKVFRDPSCRSGPRVRPVRGPIRPLLAGIQ